MSGNIITYGQVAYEAYYDASDGKSLVSGQPLPHWRDQDEPVIRAWNRAGAAVCDEIIGIGEPGSELAVVAAVRERLENLAAGMDLSASTSHPSKKSEIERGCAQAVREIAAQLGGAR